MAIIDKSIHKKKPILQIKHWRILTGTLFVLLILGGYIGRVKIGAPSALDVLGLKFICPLGFLQMTLAKRSLLPHLLLPFMVSVVAISLFGRFFCSWFCPSTLLNSLFSKRSVDNGKKSTIILKETSNELSPKRSNIFTSYAVLGGALTSSFIFGFPVFCLICPVGLFFGTGFALIKLFTTQQFALELLVFPLVLGIEVFVLKSWCTSICPLGALQRIISSMSFGFFRPRINHEKCLQTRQINCQACRKACPEQIDLVESEKIERAGCTNCWECIEKCPTNAIKIHPFG